MLQELGKRVRKDRLIHPSGLREPAQRQQPLPEVLAKELEGHPRDCPILDKQIVSIVLIEKSNHRHHQPLVKADQCVLTPQRRVASDLPPPRKSRTAPLCTVSAATGAGAGVPMSKDRRSPMRESAPGITVDGAAAGVASTGAAAAAAAGAAAASSKSPETARGRALETVNNKTITFSWIFQVWDRN